MPSAIQDLDATLTARWYRSARAPAQAGSWQERRRCYHALAAILAGQQSARPPVARPRGLLSDVAKRAGFASAETVYKRWREPVGDRPDRRWPGHDAGIKPGAAFVLEAKIVSFWPYREGALQVADSFEMSLAEIAASYYRALAAWAVGNPALAACEPAGPPACVREDLAVLARRFARACPSPVAEAPVVARLMALADEVVSQILDDGGLAPAGAFEAVRAEVLGLLTPPSRPVAARTMQVVTELADQLLHGSPGDAQVAPGQARQLMAALDEVRTLLARAVAEPPIVGAGPDGG